MNKPEFTIDFAVATAEDFIAYAKSLKAYEMEEKIEKAKAFVNTEVMPYILDRTKRGYRDLSIEGEAIKGDIDIVIDILTERGFNITRVQNRLAFCVRWNWN